MVGEQGEHVVVLGGEHFFDEAVQSLLRPDLDEDAGTSLVQGVQAFDELHGLGDLATQDLEHGLGVGRGGVEVAGHVGHDREFGAADLQAAHRDLQRSAGAGHDLGVEGVRDRDPHRGHSGGLERLNGCLDSGGRPTDHSLGIGVDVGHHDVAVHRSNDPLDVGHRPEHSGHRPVVVLRDVGHLASARAHRFQRSVESQRTGGHQRSVLSEAVPHDQVGGDPVGGQQLGQRGVGGQHRGLGDLGL